MSHAGKAVKANRKERMIEIRVRFFTNGMDSRSGYIIPKHAWPNGTVQMDRNESHGIEPDAVQHFASLMEIPLAIEKVLIKHGIKIQNARRMGQYIEA